MSAQLTYDHIRKSSDINFSDASSNSLGAETQANTGCTHAFLACLFCVSTQFKDLSRRLGQLTKISLLVTTALFATHGAHADTLFGIYAGAGAWEQEHSGDISSNGSVVDIETDLGFDPTNNATLYVALEHGIPVLPNIRAQYFSIEVDGSSTLARNIQFNGQSFNITANLDSAIEFTQTDAILYYETLDNIVSLDLGVALSLVEGSIEVRSTGQIAEADFDEFVPMAYARTRIDLPFTGMWLGAGGQGISYDGNRLLEFDAQFGWESDLGLGFEAGWRSVQLELESFDSVDQAELDVSGPYASVNYHF